MNKFFSISCLVTLLFLLSGCELTKQPPTCDQMKRQWLYNTTNLNTEASWATGSQQQNLKQQISANNCN